MTRRSKLRISDKNFPLLLYVYFKDAWICTALLKSFTNASLKLPGLVASTQLSNSCCISRLSGAVSRRKLNFCMMALVMSFSCGRVNTGAVSFFWRHPVFHPEKLGSKTRQENSGGRLIFFLCNQKCEISGSWPWSPMPEPPLFAWYYIVLLIWLHISSIPF